MDLLEEIKNNRISRDELYRLHDVGEISPEEFENGRRAINDLYDGRIGALEQQVFNHMSDWEKLIDQLTLDISEIKEELWGPKMPKK